MMPLDGYQVLHRKMTGMIKPVRGKMTEGERGKSARGVIETGNRIGEKERRPPCFLVKLTRSRSEAAQRTFKPFPW